MPKEEREMKFLYHIVTLDGRKLDIEAESAEQALELLGIALKECRKWYPFPKKKVLTAQEKEEIRRKFIAIRDNPVYREHSREKRRVKRRIKFKPIRVKTVIGKPIRAFDVDEIETRFEDPLARRLIV